MAGMTKAEAEDFFAEFFLGRHHMPTTGVRACGNGWMVTTFQDLATFDIGNLTRLVFMAHDRCVRVCVMPASPRYIRIAIWRRSGRTGRMWERHPSLEQAVERWRVSNPDPETPEVASATDTTNA